ncbi:MAG TPA: tetratricopeptide repeat protein, partial [Candidatus Dormibacteraeota bacterium]|nr:tetratricopeptide repeat protein [Candidatus Dormibacteraeota bacterium]
MADEGSAGRGTATAEERRPDPDAWVARSLYNQGIVLGRLGRDEEEIRAYDQVVRRFATSSDPEVLETVAMALCNKGVALERLGRHEAAVRAYDELLRRFAGITEIPLLRWVAAGLYGKGHALGRQGRHEEEIAVYRELAGWEANGEPAIEDCRCRAHYAWAVRLGGLGRLPE